jgi:hypothetical protein
MPAWKHVQKNEDTVNLCEQHECIAALLKQLREQRYSVPKALGIETEARKQQQDAADATDFHERRAQPTLIEHTNACTILEHRIGAWKMRKYFPR